MSLHGPRSRLKGGVPALIVALVVLAAPHARGEAAIMVTYQDTEYSE